MPAPTIKRRGRRHTLGTVLAVTTLLVITACRDGTVSDTMRPEEAVLARRRVPSQELTLENSAWLRRFEADIGSDCYTRRFRDADTLGSGDGLNLSSCPSQMVVTPNAGDGTYSLWHSPDATAGNGSADSLVVTFSRPVGMLAILRDGTHSCYDTAIGLVVAYGPDGAELGRSPFNLIQTCSDAPPALREDHTAVLAHGVPASTSAAPYTSPYAPFADAVLPIPAGVTRLVFLPPEVWDFAFVNPYFPDDIRQYRRQGTYSLIFRPDEQQTLPTVEILSAGGPNVGGSFIVRAPEDVIRLEARVTPASLAPSVEWEVAALDTFMVRTVPPDSVRRGASSSFLVPQANISPGRFRRIVNARGDTVADPGRWPVLHNGALNKKALAYRITAKVTANGQTVRSSPVTVQQDEKDVMREEYVECGWPLDSIPPRDSLSTRGPPERNLTGDYQYWITGARLEQKLPVMLALSRQVYDFTPVIMSGYRNPVHHFVHAKATARRSQHLTGNATDWGILAPSSRPSGYTANTWFTQLFYLTRDSTVDGCWEPAQAIRDGSGGTLDHAHSDWRVMTLRSCPESWRRRN